MKQITAATALMAAVSGPVMAFDIDFAAVFAAHPDQVEVFGPNVRSVTLVGPVEIRETRTSDGAVSYYAMDHGPRGAAGCMFNMLVDLAAAAAICPEMLEPGEQSRLAKALARSAAFVAVNAVPPVPSDEIAARLSTLLANRRAALSQGKAVICPVSDDVRGLAQQAARVEFAAAQAQLHALPRLPVANPCM